jgi:hypothetical protein
MKFNFRKTFLLGLGFFGVGEVISISDVTSGEASLE